MSGSPLDLLKHIYQVYGAFADELELACQPGCADCCTRNVTLTGLEARLLLDHIQSTGQTGLLERLRQQADHRRFFPRVTVNHLAELCLENQEPPDEEPDPAWGACPFLSDNHCPVYAARPFACRCMVSEHDCRRHGHAQVRPFWLTVHDLFLQYIEHIDAGGYFGNLTDILLYLEPGEDGPVTRAAHEKRLLVNRPVRALMVPPRHRERIHPIVQALGAGGHP